jgi:hypothetical protein
MQERTPILAIECANYVELWSARLIQWQPDTKSTSRSHRELYLRWQRQLRVEYYSIARLIEEAKQITGDRETLERFINLQIWFTSNKSQMVQWSRFPLVKSQARKTRVRFPVWEIVYFFLFDNIFCS